MRKIKYFVWAVTYMLFIFFAWQTAIELKLVEVLNETSMRVVLMNPRMMFYILTWLIMILVYFLKENYLNPIVKIRYGNNLSFKCISKGFFLSTLSMFLAVGTSCVTAFIYQLQINYDILLSMLMFWLMVLRIYIAYSLIYFLTTKSLIGIIYVTVKYFSIYIISFFGQYYDALSIICTLIQIYYFTPFILLVQDIVFLLILVMVIRKKECI